MPQIETSRPAIAERTAALLSLLALVAGIGWLVVGVVVHIATALDTAGHLRPASAAEHRVLIMNLKSGAGRPSDSGWPRNAGRGASSQSCCGP